MEIIHIASGNDDWTTVWNSPAYEDDIICGEGRITEIWIKKGYLIVERSNDAAFKINFRCDPPNLLYVYFLAGDDAPRGPGADVFERELWARGKERMLGGGLHWTPPEHRD